METLRLHKDIHVFGREVKTFPLGVGDAFDALSKEIPDGLTRNWYGLSKMKEDGGILYIAAAEERSEDEAKKFNCERFVIRKGVYTTQPIQQWMKKIDSIKDVFHEMLQDNRIDTTHHCVEWYKSDDEMVCMVKLLDSQRVGTNG